MTAPKTQNQTPELQSAHEVTRPEWTPPQLDKLPIADTAVAFVGNIPDGIDFSS